MSASLNDEEEEEEPALLVSSDEAGSSEEDQNSSLCSCCQCSSQIPAAGSGGEQQFSSGPSSKRNSTHDCQRPTNLRPDEEDNDDEREEEDAGQPEADPTRPSQDRDSARASPTSARPPEQARGPERLESEEERQERELALTKRGYVLAELVETERDYVADLGRLVEGYLVEIRRQLVDCGVDDILTTGVVVPQSQAQPEPQQTGGDPDLVSSGGQAQQAQQAGQPESTSTAPKWPPLPDALKDGKHKIIFGNIEAIYEFHRDHFLLELERCLQEPHRLGPLFKRYERRLNMYVVYCQNKPRSEAIVSEYLDSYFEVSLRPECSEGDKLLFQGSASRRIYANRACSFRAPSHYLTSFVAFNLASLPNRPSSSLIC